MFLILRNRTYHFRYRLPVKLVPILGRYEIRASLRTTSKRTAQPIASRLARDCRCIFMRLELEFETLSEDGLKMLDPNTLNRILRNYVNEVVTDHLSTHAVSQNKLKDTIMYLVLRIDSYRNAIQRNEQYDRMSSQIDNITQENGLEITEADRRLLALHLAHGFIQGTNQAIEILESGGSIPMPISEHGGPVSEPVSETASEPRTQSKPSITLQELVTQYTKHQLRTGAWRKNSARNAEPQLNALLSYLKPETPIRSLTVHQMQSYLDLLQALPPRYNLLKAYKGRELHELDPKQLMKDHDTHLDQTTIRGYMIMARQLLDYAEELDLIDKNPCPKALVPKKKQVHAREQRDAYTIDQLHEVFNPERYMRWVNYRGFDPAKFWIPLLCLSSTGRLEEICGLRAADVQSTDAGLNLRITFHDERLIKNQNSDRVVPVVPVIAERLLDYAESLPKESRLFPQLTMANNKLSHNFGKAWGRYVRDKVGIDDPKIAPMHSLRHFLIDRLYKALVPVQVIKALDGHAPGGGETGSRYAKGLEVETLREHCLLVIERELEGVLRPLIREL